MFEEYIKDLSGHSGCKISLYRNQDGFLVRKSAGSPDYNDRLRVQMIKQAWYKSSKNADIRAPKVYKNGITAAVNMPKPDIAQDTGARHPATLSLIRNAQLYWHSSL